MLLIYWTGLIIMLVPWVINVNDPTVTVGMKIWLFLLALAWPITLVSFLITYLKNGR